jgi:uncharacterized cupin superfamily protein
MGPVTHWDDLEVQHHELGPMSARWRTADGVKLGMSRIEVLPGAQSTPAHLHTAEEELFYVVGGSGLWWQGGVTTAIGAGDVTFAKPRGEAHTIIGGDEGIDVLAFGPRHDIELVHLPRPGVLRVGGVATLQAQTRHQWFFEAEAGPVERDDPDPTRPRPGNVIRASDAPSSDEDRPGFEHVSRKLGAHLGAQTTGMRLLEVAPGARSYPFHCHSAEEELFVVLAGDGRLRLGSEEHAVRPGSIVSRPAGTGVAHQFSAGDGGLTLLCYSNIDTTDTTYFPDSNKVNLRYLDVMLRVEPVDYWDGEG